MSNITNDKVISEIIEKIEESEKRDTYYKYIGEVVERCVKLTAVNENVRVLNEYKFMVENLKKEFGI